MARLNWDTTDRPYYSGVDRGVLYVPGKPAVVWNGIVSINEEAASIIKDSHYLDGQRYVITQTNEDFDFKISAFTYPEEFDECCGYDDIYGNQPPKPFGLCYRTNYGTGNQLHLVYNAMAKESNMVRKTLSDKAEAQLFTWAVSTRTNDSTTTAPSSHLIIDLTDINATVKTNVQDILYGTSSTSARLPLLPELIDLFLPYAQLVVTDNGDGTWTATGPPEAIQTIDSSTFQIDWPSALYLDPVTFKLSNF